MTAGIVGLGLIGGSLAKAYRAHGARVLAFDTDGAVLSFAQLDGTVDAVLTKENVSECDIVLIAVRPGAAISYLREAAPHIGARPVVIDCCGVKREVCETAFALAREHGFTFLGGHPMAGSHRAGYKNARANLSIQHPWCSYRRRETISPFLRGSRSFWPRRSSENSP